MSAAEEYLWDPSSGGDRGVAAFESALRSFRQPPPGFNTAAAHGAQMRRRRARTIQRAAAATLLVAGGLWMVRSPAPWEVEAISGVPRISPASGTAATGAPNTANAAIVAGMVVETDGISRARLHIGSQGSAELSPASRVRVLRADARGQQLSLEQGALAAQLSGEAGAFVLETPFARATGRSGEECEFQVRVDSSGAGLVGVSEGTLTLEGDGRLVTLPAGNVSSLGAGRGPGLPFAVGATDRFKALVGDIDSLGASPERVEALLAVADDRSTITLFHLLPLLAHDQRLQAIDRLASLAPPPPGVTREGLMHLDSAMLARWEPALRRNWEGQRRPAWFRWWRRIQVALD